MPKIGLSLSRYPDHTGTIEISVEAERVSSAGTPYYPLLQIPLEIVLRPIPARGEENINFALAKLEGSLFLPDSERIAEFSTQPMCYETHGREYDFTETLVIPIDLRRIERIEEVRRGGDINLSLHFCGSAWVVEKPDILPDRVLGDLLFLPVVQSHWARNILPNWKYGQVELVEIWFPEDHWGNVLAQGYPGIKEAMSHFNYGNDKEVLASIYRAFEAIARELGFKNPDKNFFTKLFILTPIVKTKNRQK